MSKEWKTVAQLGKGGKHVFGWSRVADDGQVRIPPEGVQEYSLGEAERLLVIPGSRTSGGFGLGTAAAVWGSPLGSVLKALPDLARFSIPEGEAVEHRGRVFCWVRLRAGAIRLPREMLGRSGVAPGDDLLVIRGSGLALAFAVRGPLVELAREHNKLDRFSACGERGQPASLQDPAPGLTRPASV